MDSSSTSSRSSMWGRSWIRSQGLFWYLAGIGMVWDWFQTPASGQDSEPGKGAKDWTQRRSTRLEVARKADRVLSSAPKSNAAKKSGRDVSPFSSGLGLLLAEKKSGGVVGGLTQADPGDGGRKVVVLHNTVGVTNNILDAVKSASSSSAPSARRPAWTASYATGESRSHGPTENILMPLRSNADLVVEPQPSSVKSFDRFSMTDSGTNTPVSRSSVISIESSFTAESSVSSAAQLAKEEELFDPTSLQKERFASVKEVEEHESRSLLNGGAAIEWRGKSLNESFSSVADVEEHELHAGLRKGATIEWGGDCLQESETLNLTGCCRTLSEDGSGVEHERTSDGRAGIRDQGQGTSSEGSNTLSQLGGRDDLRRRELGNSWTQTPSAPDEEPRDDCSLHLMTVPQAAHPQTALDHGFIGGGGGAEEGTAQLHEGPSDGNIAGGNCSVCGLDGVSEDGDARCAGDACVDGDGGRHREAASVVEEDEGKSTVKVGESCGESSASYKAQLHEGPTDGNVTGGNFSVCALSDVNEDGDARCAGDVCVGGGNSRPREATSVVEEDKGKGAVKVGESCGGSSASFTVDKEGGVCGFPDNGMCANGPCMDGGDESLGERVGVVKADEGKGTCELGEVCAERSFGDMTMVAEEDVCGLDATGCPDDGRSEDDQCVEGSEGDDDVNIARIDGFGECTDTSSDAAVSGESGVFAALGVTALQQEDGCRGSDDDLCTEGEELGVRDYSVNPTAMEGREEMIDFVRERDFGVGHHHRCEGAKSSARPDGLTIANDDVQCQGAGKTGSEGLPGKREDCVVDGDVRGVVHVPIIGQGSAIKSTIGDPSQAWDERLCIDTGYDGLKEADCLLKNILRLEALTGAVEETDEGTGGGGTEEVTVSSGGVKGAEEGVVDQRQLLGSRQKTSIVSALIDLDRHSNLPERAEPTLPEKLSAVEQSMAGADGRQPTNVTKSCLESGWDGVRSECDFPNKTLCNFQVDATGGMHDVVAENATRTLSVPSSVTISSICLSRSLDAVSLPGDTSQVAGGKSLPAFSLPCDGCQVVEKPAELAGAGLPPVQSVPLSCSSCVSLIEGNDASLSERRGVVKERPAASAGNLRPTLGTEVASGLLLYASHPAVTQPPFSVPASLSHPTVGQPPFSVPASLSYPTVAQPPFSVPASLSHPTVGQPPFSVPASLSHLTVAQPPFSVPAALSHPTVAQPPFSVPASLPAMSSSRSAALLDRSVPAVSLAQMTSQTSIPVAATDINEVWSNLPIDEDNNHPQSFAATAQLGESQLLLPHWSSIVTAQSDELQSSQPYWSSAPCRGQTETVATGTVSTVENSAHRERIGVPPEVACVGVSGEPETAGFFPPGPFAAEAAAGFERHGDECGNPVEKPCVSYSQVMDPERNTRPDACCTRRTDWERAVYVAMCREYTENLFRQLVSQHLQEYTASASAASLLRNYSNCEGSSRGDKAGSLVADRSAAVQMASAYPSPQMEFAATEPEAVQKQGVMLGPPGVAVGKGPLASELCQPRARNEPPVLELMARQFVGHGESDVLPEEANIQAVVRESRSASSSAFECAGRVDGFPSVERDGGGGGQVGPNPSSTQGKEQAALQGPGHLRQIGTGAGQQLVLDVGSSSTRAGDIEERVMSANKGLLRRLQHPDVGKRMIVKNLGVLMVMLVTVVLYTRMICKGAVAWAKDHPRRNGQPCKGEEQPRPEESV